MPEGRRWNGGPGHPKLTDTQKLRNVGRIVTPPIAPSRRGEARPGAAAGAGQRYHHHSLYTWNRHRVWGWHGLTSRRASTRSRRKRGWEREKEDSPSPQTALPPSPNLVSRVVGTQLAAEPAVLSPSHLLIRRTETPSRPQRTAGRCALPSACDDESKSAAMGERMPWEQK